MPPTFVRTNAMEQEVQTRIGEVTLAHPFGLAPMAGMTDSAFRRLVKRQAGCGLVVTEMVSSEGLVRGIDRTLEFAEFTEEERPVSIQVFGGDLAKMAASAQILESLGADIVDVNMGCPVPKIAKHHAGCSLMRDPRHAAAIVGAMVRAVKIPVTVKMRSGWNENEINAPELARRVEDVGASGVTVHGRTAKQSYAGRSDWDLISTVARSVEIPVFGSGDCVEPAHLLNRVDNSGAKGVLVGRGALRNPWIFSQALDLVAGNTLREVRLEERGRFLLDYLDLLLGEGVDEVEGFRHTLPSASTTAVARGRDRWVINKLRALSSWYTKGFENGSRLRQDINAAESLADLRRIIQSFFFASVGPRAAA